MLQGERDGDAAASRADVRDHGFGPVTQKRLRDLDEPARFRVAESGRPE